MLLAIMCMYVCVLSELCACFGCVERGAWGVRALGGEFQDDRGILLKAGFSGSGEEVQKGFTEFRNIFHFVHPDTPMVCSGNQIH